MNVLCFYSRLQRFYLNWPPAIAPHVGFTADHNCYQRNLAPAGAGVKLIKVRYSYSLTSITIDIIEIRR